MARLSGRAGRGRVWRGAGEGGDGQLACLQTSEEHMAADLTAMQSNHYTSNKWHVQ